LIKKFPSVWEQMSQTSRGDFFDSLYSIPVSHPHMIIQWIEIWWLEYQRGYF